VLIAKLFAESIRKVLSKAEFTIAPVPKKISGTLAFSAPGAWIMVRDLKDAPSQAGAIQKAFAAAGVFLEGVAKPEYLDDPNDVVIAVSSHPFKPEPVPPALAAAAAKPPQNKMETRERDPG
jgi:hypothetical protein